MSEYEETRVMERAEPAGPPPPWWRENLWIWLAVLGIVAVALVLFFALRGGGGDERTTVPDVVGLPEAAAVERIEAAELEAEVVREPSDDPQGRVAAQTPGAGTQVAEGSEVTLTVSSGPTQTETETETETETVTTEPETTSMPDVVGLPMLDATRSVAAADLWPQTFPVESAEARGTVVAQNPAPNTELPAETPVRLNVALGSGPRDSTQVPDLTGPAALEALSLCHESNLTCRVVLRAAPSPENVGEAIDQQPQAGASVPVLTQVTIFVGR